MRIVSSVKYKLSHTVVYRMLRYDKNDLGNYADKIYNESQGGIDKSKLKRKMRLAYVLYGLPFGAFSINRCENLSFSQIREIVPWKEQKSLYIKINSKSSKEVLCNKFKTFNLFGAYFKRDVVQVMTNKDLDTLRSFCDKHSRFIAKPLGSFSGRGVNIIDVRQQDKKIENLLDEYGKGFIAEELIQQDTTLAQFHPSSVNTLRINTVNYGDEIEVKWPCLRMGRGGNVVDNAGAGGVFGAIDVQSGKIIAACDESRHTFEKHPDTGLQIVGFEIPHWKEACEMAMQLAKLLPDCHFVGWDLALTPKGWVMVEGNYKPLLIWQYAVDGGIRPEFEQMKKKLKANGILAT